MVGKTGGVKGIDPDSWQVAILPLPPRFSRGTALGFCGGHPVGRAENARARSIGCWWPGGKPELLTLEGYKDVATGRARGDVIPGQWTKGTSSVMGAAIWSLQDGRLLGSDAHDQSYEKSWATSAGGGVVVGAGVPPRQAGQRAHKLGLVWSPDQKPVALAAAGDVSLLATDGTRMAGSINGRAALWPSTAAAPIDLAPEKLPASEVQALDGESQIGIAWKGMCARAALWQGTAGSFCDLTPSGFATASAYDGARGFQVGFVRARDSTRNGNTGADNRAVLWQSAADRWIDLNAMLPQDQYNASIAWAIEIRDDTVYVCGEASRFEVSGAGTPQESHVVPVAHPVLWSARLGG